MHGVRPASTLLDKLSGQYDIQVGLAVALRPAPPTPPTPTRPSQEAIYTALWSFLRDLTHRDKVASIEDMPLTSNQHRCRAWIRISLNESLFDSYLDTMLNDPMTGETLASSYQVRGIPPSIPSSPSCLSLFLFLNPIRSAPFCATPAPSARRLCATSCLASAALSSPSPSATSALAQPLPSPSTRRPPPPPLPPKTFPQPPPPQP